MSHSTVSHSLNKHDTGLFKPKDTQQHNSIHCMEKINSIEPNVKEICPIFNAASKAEMT